MKLTRNIFNAKQEKEEKRKKGGYLTKYAEEKKRIENEQLWERERNFKEGKIRNVQTFKETKRRVQTIHHLMQGQE